MEWENGYKQNKPTTNECKMHKYLFLNKYEYIRFQNFQQYAWVREDSKRPSNIIFDDLEPENSNFSFRDLDDANVEECIKRWISYTTSHLTSPDAVLLVGFVVWS